MLNSQNKNKPLNLITCNNDFGYNSHYKSSCKEKRVPQCLITHPHIHTWESIRSLHYHSFFRANVHGNPQVLGGFANLTIATFLTLVDFTDPFVSSLPSICLQVCNEGHSQGVFALILIVTITFGRTYFKKLACKKNRFVRRGCPNSY